VLKRPTTLLFAAALASSGCKSDPQVVGDFAPDQEQPVGVELPVDAVPEVPEVAPVPTRVDVPVGDAVRLDPQPVGRPAKTEGQPITPIRSPTRKVGKSIAKPRTPRPPVGPVPKPDEPLTKP
jgi:hypothetical protein